MSSKKVKLKIKVGDTVQVITGDDKGAKGQVLSVNRKTNRVLVENVNIVKKHQKPTNDSPGGIIDQPAPIHISNVMLVDRSGNATRVGRRIEEEKLVRFSKSTQETI